MSYKRSIRRLLEDRRSETPEFVFAWHEDRQITFRALDREVNRLAGGLLRSGIGAGARVAVMMENHLDHIATFFALCKLGAILVPINIQLRGPSLEFILEHAAPAAVIAEADYWSRLDEVLPERNRATVILRKMPAPIREAILDFGELKKGEDSAPPTLPILDEIRCISFTSGTTGPPKGVLMTEKMLRACATGAALASEASAGDTFLLWEPLYHTSGVQMCILSLMEPIRLVVTPRFSASRFWDLVRRHRVTKLHYLGGVLDILLKQPVREDDDRHCAGIAFGGGCSSGTWVAFEKRFNVKIREVYGLTEASGFSTLNRTGKVGSIGKPLPYFDVRIAGDDGNPLPAGSPGEILIREKEPGLITPGYLDDPELTASALKDGWLHTGDLGRCDEEGDLYYMGRKKESIRRRGENISAWEVEHVLNMHPNIRESAVIGVDAEIGEQELKAFIVTSPGTAPDPVDIINWCESRMPRFQIPRYIAFIDAFEKTSTERIRKGSLSRETDDCWDMQRGEEPEQ